METQARKRGFTITATVASLALASGCSGLPPIDESRTVQLNTDFMGYKSLEVDVDGDPGTRPGAMASDGLQAAVEMCNVFFWACALVTVPVGAATGAVITAIETLPEEQAHALNYVTANVAGRIGADLDMAFDDAMRDEAARHGIELKSVFADVSLTVYIDEIFWNVSVGNHVAIEAMFRVVGRADGKSGSRNIRMVSDSAKVEDWVAGSGERIEEALNTMVEDASVEIWRRILDQAKDEQT